MYGALASMHVSEVSLEYGHKRSFTLLLPTIRHFLCIGKTNENMLYKLKVFTVWHRAVNPRHSQTRFVSAVTRVCLIEMFISLVWFFLPMADTFLDSSR